MYKIISQSFLLRLTKMKTRLSNMNSDNIAFSAVIPHKRPPNEMYTDLPSEEVTDEKFLSITTYLRSCFSSSLNIVP